MKNNNWDAIMPISKEEFNKELKLYRKENPDDKDSDEKLATYMVYRITYKNFKQNLN